MSLNGIASAALSALQTNSTALRVVSNNVANLNTVGYARRVVISGKQCLHWLHQVGTQHQRIA